MTDQTIAQSDTLVRDLGQTKYEHTLDAMQQFTQQRDRHETDQIWLTEHLPVFTQGQAGKDEHLLAPADVPVVQSDRGGQVTYHGPGQITAYLLLDLRRKKMGVRDLVTGIERAIQQVLQQNSITSELRPQAPGVYVGSQKIAQLGLRVRRGCCYHGLSLNVDMDLEPFSRINPCGLTDITTTDMAAFGAVNMGLVKGQLLQALSQALALMLTNRRPDNQGP
jgi:lipoyl(octanoyl) transferase